MNGTIVRTGLYAAALLMLVISAGQSLLATAVVPAPEIDGGTLSAGLACLAGGVLMLRARRAR
jgi:hypothetical protein